MSFYPELEELSTEELIAAFEGTPPPGDLDDPMLYYPEVAVRLAEQGAVGLEYLESALTDTDPYRGWAAIIGLGRSPDVARYEPNIVSFLKDTRPIVVAAAIDYLTGHNLVGYLNDVAALVESPDVAVATAALRYLAMIHPNVAERWLGPALRHPNPLLRWHALDGFEDVGNRADAARIEMLLNDNDDDVRGKAAQAIYLLRNGELRIKPSTSDTNE